MDVPESPWSVPADRVVGALDVDIGRGLDEAEAAQRREVFGPNRLEEARRRGVVEILWNQLQSVIVLLLLVAGVASLVMGELADAVAIGVVLALNTVIGFVAEWRAQRSMEALRAMGRVDTCVRRGGDEVEQDAEDLVPGDVVVLRAGDVVPADLRIVESDGLQADESALTGESVPVPKQTDPVDADAATTEQAGMVFRGTAISRGEGIGVVVATGMHTTLGGISEMAAEAEGQQAPLDQRLDHLGRRLTVVTVAVAVVVIGAGVLAGRDVPMMLQTGVALAVAAIPEGLPIVATVALARGMWRMAAHDALVRNLPAVETLGSTTLVCTDKTGTLTRNEMRLSRLVLADGRNLEVAVGEDPGVTCEGRPVEPTDDPALSHALRVLVLANEVDDDGGVSDPMEDALLDAGRALGLPRDSLVAERPRVRLVPFDRETSMVASLHEGDDGVLVAVKGATRAVLSASREDADGSPLDDDARARWHQETEALAADGLRVLALASKTAGSADDAPYEDLHFLGLLGLLDPPRAGVEDAVADCRRAGIRVVMVTGDHPATARAIAEQVGLPVQADDSVLAGDALRSLSGDERRARLADVVAVARVTPREKLELVEAWQDDGEIVAMTGDGVNDAPALRAADVGVAMGRGGTDVAREAADIVLQDDAFDTIVTAVREGRILFGNIRKFVVYLLSGNVGEILLVTAGAVAGLPLPLLPLQILYLNVINDVFPAFALGVGPGTPGVMRRPPRDPAEPLLTRAHWGVTVGYGVLIGATVFAAFLFVLLGLGLDRVQAVTASFLTLSCARLLHVFNMRDRGAGVLQNDVTANGAVWGALAVCAGLLALAIFVGPLASVLGLAPPEPVVWAVIGVGSVVPLIVGQGFLLVARHREA